ncbi:tRNA (N(6)-L-threonylcarbamoyladenosine(37)-C(2))-methylthiotransferase MtaB [Ammoniphilus sp. CFH 90114]|uniref:tRNA (N(6)-L-threonylcarbamoyladenosine(37)-C(2))- methylthiotransferase MtaB n=1 Tax=Ammoniphilus sp. CFH 90114 TaxID=2493665 RepID=UPI00100FB2CE|nr:tRNA (N(6)-L-threonylcarbamoyladenosine(37)-C(2))-methylthiotransferase MtaB [Ammoniphilus sp. CFH 90114]RXT14816.1 tRNA (N(6)-L-threonylcarbamoyladenosine(37)-C(2))-methylthiotransferase MtaB [Ammoniphilus sp. CFH 90114]
MPTVAFQTLGCKVNHYETEAIWQIFKQGGYDQVPYEEDSDVYVINTCTVTNTGDKKSRQVIRRAVRRNPEAIVVVTGCYAQTSPAEVANIPGVDIVLGTQGREQLLSLIEEYRSHREPINAVKNIMKTRQFEELEVPDFTDRTRASLKIQEGCNNFCTFCIIPWARGLMRSRDPENVLEQARKLVAGGYKEIVLTGIHTGGYGEDLEHYNLAKLLRDLDQVEGLQRIRISSIEASQITDEVIDVLRSSDKMCRHLHIPLQAGDDQVLKRMRRKYTVEEYRKKIEQIREAMPGVAITTDVIVGFPGETRELFENGYQFIQDIQFAEMHVFPYSKRTGTPAAKFEHQIPEEIKNERVQRLIQLSNHFSLEYSKQFIGDVLDIIPESAYSDDSGEQNLFYGYSDNYLKVIFKGTPDLIGKMVRIRLDEPGVEFCKGTFLRELDLAALTS